LLVAYYVFADIDLALGLIRSPRGQAMVAQGELRSPRNPAG